MVHRTFVMEAYSTLANTIPLVHRTREVTWRCFLTATPEEKLEDLQWASSRAKSRWSNLRMPPATTLGDLTYENYLLALTENEYKALTAYPQDFEPNCVHMLGQSQSKGRGVSSTPDVLNAIIKNAGIMWSTHDRRFLTPSELMLAQGLINKPESMELQCSTSFARARDDPRKRMAVVGQVGNAMNTHVFGCVFVHCMLNYFRTDEVDLREFLKTVAPMHT